MAGSVTKKGKILRSVFTTYLGVFSSPHATRVVFSMADQIFRGDAVAIPQVDTLTPTAENNDVYTVEINGKSVSYTADGTALVAEITAGLVAAIEASNIPEFQEITWEDDTTHITATGPSNGKPVEISAGSAGSGDLVVANVNAASSPNHWIAENFSTGTLPNDSDSVYIAGTNRGIKWNLDQSAVTLALLDIRASFTGAGAEIGLPELNRDVNNDNFYYEYRETHLKISADALRIGGGEGQGSSRIKIDTGSNACDCIVYKTGQPAAGDSEAVHLVGTHDDNALQVFGGTVGICTLPGYTGKWPTIYASGGTVRCGSGVTLGLVESSGTATIETNSAVTTLRNRDNGVIRHTGSGNITTLEIAGGTATIQATDALTITNLNGYSGKTLDLTNSDSAVTVTNMTIYATPESPFTIVDPGNKLVMTNAASTPNGAQSLRVVSGPGRTVKVAN
jgi:hypothetical protein